MRTAIVNCRVLPTPGAGGSDQGTILIENGTVTRLLERGIPAQMRPGDRVIDLEGACVIPGIVDSHTHICTVGTVLQGGVDLFGARTRGEALRRIREHAERRPPGEWIYARGWDESLWDGGYLTRSELDGVSERYSIVAVRVCGHLCTLNTPALDSLRSRIAARSMDAQDGILTEDAVALAVERALPHRGDDPASAILIGQEHALRLGVTAVHDVVRWRGLQTYLDLWRGGRLRLRTYLLVEPPAARSLARLGISTGYGDLWLRIGGVKLFADGSIGARTAALAHPYSGERRRGRCLLPERRLKSAGGAFARSGFQVCVHAIGDRAVSGSVRALASIPPVNVPHRLEHAEMPVAEDIDIAAEHGICLSMQPNFVWNWGLPGGMYESRLGERYARMNPFRSVVESGCLLTFGSDCMPLDPMYGLRSAVDAPFPSQRLSVSEALHAYTLAGRLTSGEVGHPIQEGAPADLTVLSHDPLKDLRRAEPVMTIVAGEVSWSNGRVRMERV